MNLAFVVHHYSASSGTGGYVVELATRMSRRHEVTVYAAGFPTTPPPAVRAVVVPALRGRTYATVMSFPPGLATVRRKHDVVHAQGWVTDTADVVTAHIVLDAWRTAARAAHVATPAGERFLGGFVARRERALLRRAREVICPSNQAGRDVATCSGRQSAVTIIPHGFPQGSLPPRAESRAALGIPADAFVAAYVGDPRKGLDRALEAVSAVEGAHLLIATASPPWSYGSRDTYRSLAGRLHWPPPLPDVRTAYAAANVLIHPTIYDTFAMVVAEALAFGLPAIVTRQAGISELLVHGENAWIAERDTDVGKGLRAVRDDDLLRDRLRRGGLALAATRTWDDVARETELVYQRVAR